MAHAAPVWPVAQLNTVEIPGLADCLRKERRVRDEAFLEGMPEEVAGIRCAALTLRHWHWLTLYRNGFVVPCEFESDSEMLEHAQQLLWIITPGLPRPSAVQPYTHRYRLRERLAKWRACWHVFRRAPRRLVAAVNDYVDEAFFDNPFRSDGTGDNFHPSGPAHAAFIIDLFAAAGYPWTRDEILDTPLKQIWQLTRQAVQRLNPDASAPNPSDYLKVEHIARLNRERSAA